LNIESIIETERRNKLRKALYYLTTKQKDLIIGVFFIAVKSFDLVRELLPFSCPYYVGNKMPPNFVQVDILALRTANGKHSPSTPLFIKAELLITKWATELKTEIL
jgi:hypothetical protein